MIGVTRQRMLRLRPPQYARRLVLLGMFGLTLLAPGYVDGATAGEPAAVVSGVSFSPDGVMRVYGRGTPGQEVRVAVDGIGDIVRMIDSDGTWVVAGLRAQPGGVYEITAQATGGSDNGSIDSLRVAAPQGLAQTALPMVSAAAVTERLLADVEGVIGDVLGIRHAQAQGSNTQNRDTQSGAPSGGDDVVGRVRRWLDRADREYREQVVPRLSAGGERKPVQSPSGSKPDGGSVVPSLDDVREGIERWIDRADKEYRREVVPRLSGQKPLGLPAIVVAPPTTRVRDTAAEADRRRAEEAMVAAERERRRQAEARAAEERAARERQAADEAERRRQAETRAAEERAERERQAAADEAERRRQVEARAAQTRAAEERAARERQAAADEAERRRQGEARAAEVRAAEERAARERQAASDEAERRRQGEARAAEVRAAEERGARERQAASDEAERRRQAEVRAAEARAAEVRQARERQLASDEAERRRQAEVRAAEARAAEERTARERQLAADEAERRRQAEVRAAEARAAAERVARERQAVADEAERRRQAEVRAAEARAAEARAAEERAERARQAAAEAERRRRDEAARAIAATQAAAERERQRAASEARRRAEEARISEARRDAEDRARLARQRSSEAVDANDPAQPSGRASAPRDRRVVPSNVPERRETSMNPAASAPVAHPSLQAVTPPVPERTPARRTGDVQPREKTVSGVTSGAVAGPDTASGRGEPGSRQSSYLRVRRTAPVYAPARCRAAGRLADGRRYYVVARGDSLWRISRRHYRRGSRYPVIWRANAHKIANPDLIYPCQRFRIPRLRRH